MPILAREDRGRRRASLVYQSYAACLCCLGTWIIQGLAALIGEYPAACAREGGWIAFGVISLIAGIVVAATPDTSLAVPAMPA